MSFAPTEEQMKIFDIIGKEISFRGGQIENLAVDAVAGSGKTTTAVASIPYAKSVHKRLGFTAFSKEIAKTLQAKVGLSCQSGTMHSLGFGLVKERFGDVALVNWKYDEIAKREFPSLFISGRNGFKRIKPEFAAFGALCRIIREQNLEIGFVSSDTVKNIVTIAEKQGISLPSKDWIPELIGACFECIQIGADNPKEIDYCDMIWLPVFHKLGVNKFDLLYGDEAQDFNPIQQKFFMQMGERKVIIGDPYQSIMGFAGADTNSFGNLTNWLDAHTRPLSTCWRCPSSHLDLARYFVPHIKAAPNARDGEICQVLEDQVVRDAGPGDMILCRSNAPLVGMAYRLFQEGKPAIVRGKNIGQGLIGLVKKLMPGDLTELNLKLGQYKEKEVRKLIDRDASQDAYTALYDQIECIQTMAGNYDSLQDFLDKAGKLFGDDEETRPDQTILSSVHRSKGLETENVTILQPSKLCAWGESEETYQQEKNLAYVALTRAKSRLSFCGKPGSGYEEGGLHGWVSTIASQNVAPSRKARF
jgi:DNA helicase-2/ATP-dependent DNA helicase PcrA